MSQKQDHYRRRGTRPGLTRAESRQLTRAKLLAAARKEFAINGLQGTNLTAILKHSEVSPGAFYHHFSDKLDLFLAIVHEMSDAFRVMLRRSEAHLQKPGSDLVSWVAELYRLTLNISRENRELFQIYAREINSGNSRIKDFFDQDQSTMRRELEQILDKVAASGHLNIAHVDWAAYLIGVFAQGATLHQISNPADDESWCSAMAQFTLGGIQQLESIPESPPGHKTSRKTNDAN